MKKLYLYCCILLLTAILSCKTQRSSKPTTQVAAPSPVSAVDKGQPPQLSHFALPLSKPITTPEQAISIAEDFVRTQGYTDIAIDLKKQRLVFEKNEFATDTTDILNLRYNTLRPQAVGARAYGKGKWAVGFSYFYPEDNKVRGVTMDSIASRIIMQEDDLREDWILGFD